MLPEKTFFSHLKECIYLYLTLEKLLLDKFSLPCYKIGLMDIGRYSLNQLSRLL